MLLPGNSSEVETSIFTSSQEDRNMLHLGCKMYWTWGEGKQLIRTPSSPGRIREKVGRCDYITTTTHTGDSITSGLEPGEGALVLVEGGGGFSRDYQKWMRGRGIESDHRQKGWKRRTRIIFCPKSSMDSDWKEMKTRCDDPILLTVLPTGGYDFSLSLHQRHQWTARNVLQPRSWARVSHMQM